MKKMGKKGEGKEKQQTHRETTPNEFISGIFSRFLLCCRSISKHPSRQPGEALIHARRAPIVAVDGEPQPQQTDGHVMYAYKRPNRESGENSSIDRIHSFPGSESLDELNVVGITQDGVVCIVQGSLALNFILWNPATGSVLNIPEPDSPNPDLLIGSSAGFGFDPSSNEHAIIRIFRFSQETNTYPDLAQRFNFQTGRWDWLDNNNHRGMLMFWFLKGTCEAVVNDVPYWRVRGFDLCLKLVWFDTRTSVFNLESLPSEWNNSVSVVMGEIREGYLGAIVRSDPDLHVWTRNGENGEWSETYRVDIGSTSVSVLGRRLIGFYGDSEIVEELRTGLDAKPCLHMMKLLLVDDNDDGIKRGLEDVDEFCLEGALYYTCKMMRYRRSLAPMPRIGPGDSISDDQDRDS